MASLADRDMRILHELDRILSTKVRGSLGPFAETLVALRDALEFEDKPWFQGFTHHVVTIDSASTFVPTDPAEDEQARQVVSVAVQSLRRMVAEKLGSEVGPKGCE